MVLLSDLLNNFINRWLSDKPTQPTTTTPPKPYPLPVPIHPAPVKIAKPVPKAPSIEAVTTRYGFEEIPTTKLPIPLEPVTEPNSDLNAELPPPSESTSVLPETDTATESNTPIEAVEETPNLPKEGVNLDFGKLWKAHPTISKNEMSPCRRPDGVVNFGNQGAIRMGVCLTEMGLLDEDYDGEVCWFGHKGHSIRAGELALWLRNHSNKFGEVDIRRNVKWTDYVGRTGIMFCQNFVVEGSQGDHIDLWDGTGHFMGGGMFSWEGPAMASGGLDYIERAEEVWFWPVY